MSDLTAHFPSRATRTRAASHFQFDRGNTIYSGGMGNYPDQHVYLTGSRLWMVPLSREVKATPAVTGLIAAKVRVSQTERFW